MTNWRLNERRSGRGWDYDTIGILYDVLGVFYDYLHLPVSWALTMRSTTSFSLQQKSDTQASSSLAMPLFGMIVMSGGSSITNWSLQSKN
jgi:hypothetical protein